MRKLALLVSGSGSTMEQILVACYEGVLTGLIEPTLVIASKDGIGAIEKAQKLGFPSSGIEVYERSSYQTPWNYGIALLKLLNYYNVDLILQAGWTPKTPENVVNEYAGRIFNQHPEMLQNGCLGFGGKGMVGLAAHYARILFLRETKPPKEEWFTEVCCHRVTKKYDEGEVIWSGRVPVKTGDSAESLQERAIPVEWAVQIAALHSIATDTVRPVQKNGLIVKPEQEELLTACKKEAVKKYPFHG